MKRTPVFPEAAPLPLRHVTWLKSRRVNLLLMFHLNPGDLKSWDFPPRTVFASPFWKFPFYPGLPIPTELLSAAHHSHILLIHVVLAARNRRNGIFHSFYRKYKNLFKSAHLKTNKINSYTICLVEAVKTKMRHFNTARNNKKPSWSNVINSSGPRLLACRTVEPLFWAPFSSTEQQQHPPSRHYNQFL